MRIEVYLSQSAQAYIAVPVDYRVGDPIGYGEYPGVALGQIQTAMEARLAAPVELVVVLR